MGKTMHRKKIHPVIQAYISSDRPLLEILESMPQEDDPAGRALLYIQECLARRKLAKDAIAAAQAVPIEKSDPGLLIFMLSSWAELSCRIGRPSEGEALIHRVNALLSSKTRPEIRGGVLLVESIIADTKGNKALREEKLRQTLKIIPSSSPRFKFYLWENLVFLAQQGRGVESRQDVVRLEKLVDDNFPGDRTMIIRFIDAVETGHLSDALECQLQLSESSLFPDLQPRLLLDGYTALLNLLLPNTPRTQGITARHRVGAPIWIDVVRCLLHRRVDQALRFARHEAGRLRGSFLGSTFESFNLIRAELAAGNAEAARRLLHIRHARGNQHYLDNLFFARVEWLVNNRDLAAARFSEALKDIHHFEAQGRLDIEMQLAVELSRGDLIALTLEAGRLASAHQNRALSQAAEKAAPSPPLDNGVHTIIGRNPSMVQVRETIIRIADADASVLITGATGTGKELVARALHEVSRRRDQPFIAVNCGSIAESLLESELFGHRRGAFTGADKASKGLFEEAGDGTIFLDEMGSIDPRLQAALLRVLETGEIRAVGSATTRKIKCRVVAATNTDLHRQVESGHFRPDLLFRLQRLGIHLPPLRERPEDILTLAQHFLDSGRPQGVRATLSPDLVGVLQSYEWPGNVRELSNVIERMRLMHSDKLSYSLRDLDLKFRAFPANTIERIPLPAVILEARKGDMLSHGLTSSATEPTVLAASSGYSSPLTVDTDERDIDAMLMFGRSQLRRLDRLRALFERHEKLTRSEIIRVTRISPNTATKDLKMLCDEGFIERVEPSASTRTHYFRLCGSSSL